MLKLRFKNNKYNAVWLIEPKVTIGRAITNDLVVDDAYVADCHLEVLVAHEQLTLKNLVPNKPVKVNDADITTGCKLVPDDVILLGKLELLVVDPKRELKKPVPEVAAAPTRSVSKATAWALKANHTALGNRVFAIKEVTVIGRAPECDISLPAAHLSRRHAQLQVLDGFLYVKDLGSANGTYLNGKQVTEARVKRGDELRFDALSFGVLGPADELAQTTVRSRSPEKSDALPKPAARVTRDAKVKTPAIASEPEKSRVVHAAVRTRPLESRTKAAPQRGKTAILLLVIIAGLLATAFYFTRA